MLSCTSPIKDFGNTLQIMRVSFGAGVGGGSRECDPCSGGTNEG